MSSIESKHPLTLDTFSELLRSRVLVCDGAMGTMLHAAGVPLDQSPQELNISRGELVKAIHAAYIAAGADVIQTNTFGATRFRLAPNGLDSKVTEINLAGAQLARGAADAAGREVLVAGSVSPVTPPSGRGRFSASEVTSAFREQVAALTEGGIDLMIFETFGDLDELVQALGVVKEVAPGLPIVTQLTFLDDGRTISGQTPQEIVKQLERWEPAAIGVNCTLGPQGILEVLDQLSRLTSLPLAAQPNAGSPNYVDGQIQYGAGPEYFSRYARRFAEVGAALIGGCCGTTPRHIEAVAGAVASISPSVRKTSRRTGLTATKTEPRAAAAGVKPGALMERLREGRFVTVAELPPSTDGTADRPLQDASLLKDAGCDALLIGATPGIRPQLSPTSLAILIQQRIPGLEAILTVLTWEKSVMTLQADLLGAYAFGVRHVLCRTGGLMAPGEYANAGGLWDVDSTGLIRLLKGLNDGRDYNEIPLAQPSAFVIAARINPAAADFQREVAETRRKLAAGTNLLITPPLYELTALRRLIEASGKPADVPVLLGVLPLLDFDHAEFMQQELPGVSVPRTVLARMAAAGSSAAEAGLELASELIREARGQGLAQGIVLTSALGTADDLATLIGKLKD